MKIIPDSIAAIFDRTNKKYMDQIVARQEAVVDRMADLSNLPQREYRKLKPDQRNTIAGTAHAITRIPDRKEHWFGHATVDDYQQASTARIVETRANSVTNRLQEESRIGGNPKKVDRSWGFKLRKKRGV